MKGPIIRDLFAKDWPLKGSAAVAVIAGAVVASAVCQPSRAMFADLRYLLLFVSAVLLGALLSFFLWVPFAAIVIGPLYRLQGKLNGAPFRVGDRVRILAGPHRNRIVEVYDVWESRNQVRVDLDTQTRKDASDVFSFTEVCREHLAA